MPNAAVPAGITLLTADATALAKDGQPVSRVELEDTTLSLTLSIGGNAFAFKILMPEEYPSGEPLDMEDYTPLRPGRLPQLVSQLVARHNAAAAPGSPRSIRTSDDGYVSDSDGGSLSGDSIAAEDDFASNFLEPRSAAGGLGAFARINRREEQQARREFESDLSRARAAHGAESLGSFYSDERREHVTRMAFSLASLSAFQGRALHVDRESRAVVELGWAWNYLAASDVPRIRGIYAVPAGQGLNGERVKRSEGGIGAVVRWFLENRISKALRLNWLQRSETRQRAETLGGSDPEGSGYAARGAAVFAAKRIRSASGSGLQDSEDAESRESLLPQVPDAKSREVLVKVRMLEHTGFRRKECALALARSGLNLERATGFLCSTPGLAEKVEGVSEEELLLDCMRVLSLQLQDGTGCAGADCASGQATFNSDLEFSAPLENFHGDGCTNFMSGCLRYLKGRISTLTTHCVTCGAPLGYEGVTAAVCDRPTCEFALEQFGLGLDPAAELRENSAVANALLHITACAAAFSDGVRDSFQPSCAHLFAQAAGGAAKHKRPEPELGRDKLRGEVQRLFDALPPVSTLALHATRAELREMLGVRGGPLLYPLLQWVLTSNRSHLIALPPHHRLDGLGEHQFVLSAANPERERAFRARRDAAAAQHGGTGSFWAWHGSAAQNWHSILRAGLRNYSGTTMMTGGMAHGSGIYLASDLRMSTAYMGDPQRGWGNSGIGDFNAVALCEVVDERKGPREVCKDTGCGVYVVADETLVCTRFFFMFPGGYSGNHVVSAAEISKPKEILQLFSV
eukprot:TRINITY_DN55927_c0_g1_i1.p1 TRINITY_DN55927_c0_g1~~TRINITY_DN55927_c0_g1_i1.p1  ORF type:complete len:801 (+),score=223.01 TRINITY_DN55927_c0_g1_i1:85-2487(+)